MTKQIDVTNTSKTVLKAKELILYFVKNNYNEEIYKEVENVINNCKVYVNEDELNITNKEDSFLNYEIIGGFANEDGITIPGNITSYNGSLESLTRESNIATVIHEYAHRIRRVNNTYGNMFEEGFVTVFAEACMIYAKLNDKLPKVNGVRQSIYLNTSYKYQKAEQQVRALMHLLNERNEDINILGEYILGNESNFINKCNNIFGNNFANYYRIASGNKDNYYNNIDNSENILVDLLSNYIKKNGFNLTKHYSKDNIYLFNSESKTLDKSIVSAGISSFKEEDHKRYNSTVNHVNYINKLEKEDNKYLHDKIINIIITKYSLKKGLTNMKFLVI